MCSTRSGGLRGWGRGGEGVIKGREKGQEKDIGGRGGGVGEGG